MSLSVGSLLEEEEGAEGEDGAVEEEEIPKKVDPFTHKQFVLEAVIFEAGDKEVTGQEAI